MEGAEECFRFAGFAAAVFMSPPSPVHIMSDIGAFVNKDISDKYS